MKAAARALPHLISNDRVARVLLAVFVGLIAMAVKTWPDFETSPDWLLWRALPHALAEGRLYDTVTEAKFTWSPVAAWVMALVPSIYWPWALLHVAAVFLLRDWRMIALALLSWGFWTSTASGAPFVFVFVAGALAFKGSRPAAVVYLLLTLLMPRPVQIPLAAWLLWRAPELRWPFVGLFAIHALIVLASGYAFDWFGELAQHAEPGIGNYGPTAVLGLWWLLIGIPLGAWSWWRGKPSLAGLAISPYWLPEYLMMALIDLVPMAWPADPKPTALESTTAAPSVPPPRRDSSTP